MFGARDLNENIIGEQSDDENGVSNSLQVGSPMLFRSGQQHASGEAISSLQVRSATVFR